MPSFPCQKEHRQTLCLELAIADVQNIMGDYPPQHVRSWKVLSREPSGHKIARSFCHTAQALTIKTGGGRWDRKSLLFAIRVWRLGPFQTIVELKSSKNKHKAQNRKTHFETGSLLVAEILSPVTRQATKSMRIITMNNKKRERALRQGGLRKSKTNSLTLCQRDF